MGFAVVHMQKVKSGGVRGIQSHNDRKKPPRTNPDIDSNRTIENYKLLPCDNYAKHIKHQISERLTTGKKVRSDAVLLCNFMITSDEKTMKAMPFEMQHAFFTDSLNWFAQRYGYENIVHATVHMDETTPHMHLGVIPLTPDGRLSAKAIFTKKELTTMQTEFVRDVGAIYGLERGVQGSERTHLSEQRFKTKTAREAEEKAKMQLNHTIADTTEISKKATMIRQAIPSLERKKVALEHEVDGLEVRASRAQATAQYAEADAAKANYELEKVMQDRNALEKEVLELENRASIAQNEAQRAQIKASSSLSDATNASLEAARQREALLTLENKRDGLERELELLEPRVLKAKEVESIRGRRTVTGALKGVSFAEFESLKNTAAKVESVEMRMKELVEETNLKVDEANNAIRKADERAKAVYEERPSLKIQMENDKLQADNINLKTENDRLKADFNEVMRHIEREAPEQYSKITEHKQRTIQREVEGRDR